MPFRVGIIGARRRSQGIGQHVARHLAGLGAQVAAIVGTSPQTLALAREQLQQLYGIAAQGYLSVAEMLAREPLDAVAICSPYEHHLEHLRQALEAGVHVLCEKPLVFGPHGDPVAAAQPLLHAFAARDRVLMVNQQWPYTLGAFGQLFPESRARRRPPRCVEVWLSPDACGAEMVPAALPHALSLLLAVAPAGGEARQMEVLPREVEAGQVVAARVQLAYEHSLGVTELITYLRRVAAPPRPAAYALDGLTVHRVLEMPQYQWYLETGSSPRRLRGTRDAAPRKLAIEDPLRTLLADFLRRCQAPSAGPSANGPLGGGPVPGEPVPGGRLDASLLDALAILRDVYAIACRSLARTTAAAGGAPVVAARSVDHAAGHPPLAHPVASPPPAARDSAPGPRRGPARAAATKGIQS
jgi:hypothetical protein